MAARTQREPRLTRSRDACVVERESLTRVLGEFVEGWNRTHPDAQSGGRRHGTEGSLQAAAIGAVAWLSIETGIPVKTIQNITNTTSSRSKFTELRIADALLMAIDKPHLLHNGTITVRPRYRSERARSLCCGAAPRAFPEWTLEPTRI